MTSLFPVTPAPQVLRDYQVVGLDSVRAKLLASVQRVLLVAPTGSGKTTIAAEMIRGAIARQGAVLFLAHRKELVDQVSQRLDGIGVDHGVVMAQHPRTAPWCPVQVASIPTLARRLDQLPRATLVIVDEAHHARASTYAAVLNHYPDAPVIGLTATPWRLDNKGLGELFQDIVVAATPRALIEQGYLVPYTGYAYDIPELSQVRKVGADYNQHGLELAMNRSQLAGNIVEQWQQHCAGRRTAIFCVTVKHSQDLVQRFLAAGVPTEHLDGTTPKELREAILARLKSGETQVVCNVNVLTEGWDCPELEVIVLARPTLSLGFYLQMVGRGMRPAPGKTQCRIHDHAGCILRHGVPDAERDYSLTLDPKKSDRLRLPPVRTCKACFAIFSASLRVCPSCGYEHQPTPRELREVTKGVTAIPLEQLQGVDREKRRYLDSQMREAERRGRKPGWAAYRYKERYGEWPPPTWWKNQRVPLSAERIAELNERLKVKLRPGGA